MTDEEQAYDSLDAFCAEYGFDATTQQRMRDDMLADRARPKGNRIRKRADRGLIGRSIRRLDFSLVDKVIH